MPASSNPKKNVIYIDTEDDITAIVGKVKSASSGIVALVPPKRIGVLQSVVNLKLLHRATEASDKRLVLITNDHVLKGLAAGLAIPVAKNLQSKPEIPTATQPANSAEDDIISGEDLPVGELEKTVDSSGAATSEAAVAGLAATAASKDGADKKPLAATAAARALQKKKSGVIPDFGTFRKKLFLFGGLGVILIVFLAWAIFFAGHATVAIRAKTNVVNIAKTLQLRKDASLDRTQAIAPPVIKEIKKPLSTEYGATGKKDVGTKASGAVKLSIKDIDLLGSTVPAGTRLTSPSGSAYTTDSAVTFTMLNYKGAITSISASENGSSYNGATGPMSGAPSGVSATISTTTSGGSDKTISVVSQDDFNKARDQLQAQADSDSAKLKQELAKQFSADIVIIQESFKSSIDNPASSPAVGQEAANAKMSAEATYRMVGIKRSDLRAIYDTYTTGQIDKATQKIYSSGDDKTSFSQFNDTDAGFSVNAQTSAQVGPNINEKKLAVYMGGKRSGEIQEMVQKVQGVDDVNVKFSPFWVTRAPTDPKKIDIKFVVKND